MIELPEAVVIARQITETLCGKQVASAVANASPHKFAWYTGDPKEYNKRLAGKVIGEGSAAGSCIEFAAGDMTLSVSAPIHYHEQGAQRPAKHQLLVEFSDGTAITASAQMWGGFFCFRAGEQAGFADADVARQRPSPLSEAFDARYWAGLFDENTPKLSAKAFLATEQRIPGLGNGVLQDILWTARIHPRRKMAELAPEQVDATYRAVKSVLAAMIAHGGRDTESDLFGQPGGYKTVLSKLTLDTPCPACGTIIRREPYLGGNIYFCPGCQPMQ
jgi:formamidopyrimidine-DNA glycosylase